MARSLFLRAPRRYRGSAENARDTTPTALFAQAVEHQVAGRPEAAERHYREITAGWPDHAESWSNLALVFLGRGQAREAAEACRSAISLRPDYLDAYINLAAALEALRATDEATDVYRTLLRRMPRRADLWCHFATLLVTQGRMDQAALAFGEAAALQPDSVAALFGLARCLATLGWRDEAINLYRKVVFHDPAHAAAFSNLGTLLAAAGKFDEAAAAGSRAAALMPDNAEIQCNLGVALQRAGNAAAAVAAYQRAIAIRPDYAAAFGNLAAGLQELFKFDEAAQALTQALELDPSFESAALELIKIRRHICDWSHYDSDHERLLGYIEQEADLIFSLLLMSFPSSPAQQLACARRSMRTLNASTARIGVHPAPAADGKIRIGYLSMDFRDHPVGRLLPEMFRRHDRSRFEIIGYSLGVEDPGALRARIKGSCDGFVDLHHVSNVEAAQRIFADRVDILIDLAGPTVGSRTEIMALRPAPVQASFLGWPGTIGADCIDYVIADPFLVPTEMQPFYSERIVHLPECYQPSDPLRAFAEPGPTRADCGLPDEGFVFCSFNNTVKITPDIFDLWMRLLQRIEGSVLWLYCKSATTIRNLRERAASRGVGAERMVFASVAPMDVYLSRLRLADLFLDCHPYTAGATCNDALWAGLPVLTCVGETYVSRMAGSLLRAAGLPELITASMRDYESAAMRLATEPHLLGALRARLANAKQASPLFDIARFTKHLEAAYHRMHAHRAAGDAPQPFTVAPLPID